MTGAVVVSPIIAARQRDEERRRRLMCTRLAKVLSHKYEQLDKRHWRCQDCATVIDQDTGQSVQVYVIERKQYEKPAFRRRWYHRVFHPAEVRLSWDAYLTRNRMILVKQRWLDPLTNEETGRQAKYSVDKLSLELATHLWEVFR